MMAIKMIAMLSMSRVLTVMVPERHTFFIKKKVCIYQS